jgi:hypothetical protein
MARLRMEALEGRELMSSGIDVGLTAPLGSTKGSVVAVADFTPPIGSNKGSVVADGTGKPTTPTQGIIAILIG